METTIATREEQKQEAIARMKYLKLYPQVIKEFEKEELVNYSRGGILYWVEGEMFQQLKALLFHKLPGNVEKLVFLHYIYTLLILLISVF